jgi:hypothetical protein
MKKAPAASKGKKLGGQELTEKTKLMLKDLLLYISRKE